MKFFRFLLNDRDDKMKDKLSLATKEIETHRIDLLNIRERLEARCKDFLEMAKKENTNIYDMDYLELKKAVQIVNKSESALNQLILRLETLKDLGDIVYHLGTTLKVMKKIDKSVSELLPNLEGVFDEFSSTLSEIMVKLQIMPPSFYLNLKKEEGEEFIEKAIEYVEKKNIQEEILKSKEEIVKTKRLALLATGESMDEEEPEQVLNSSDLDKIVLDYIHEHKDNFNLMEASTLLDVPLDEVKHSILRRLHKDLF